MANQPVENFLLADNLQQKVETENVDLTNASPTVPVCLPNNPTVVKEWHQSVTQDLRHHLVQKIVKAIFPATDISKLQDSRLINLLAYAQKVEGSMYNAANSREEYYQLLADKIYKIQKELEERRQKRKELGPQQQQFGNPNLVPTIGNSLAAPNLYNDQASQCSPQNLNHIPTQQTAQSPQSQVPTKPLLQSNSIDAIANQLAQSCLIVDNFLQEVKTENAATINAPPTVPPNVPQMPISNLPVSHSVGQQSSASVVSVAGQAVSNNQPPKAHPEKSKLIQQQLIFLLHAHKCQKRENQSIGEVRQCTLPHCRTMKHVLSHMTSCLEGKLCPVPHCSSSRQIISHWKNCTRCDCPVCVPLKRASDRHQQAVNDQAPQCSSQNLNHIPTQQTAQNPQSQVPTWPLLQNNSTSAIANQPAQNFLLADNLQQKVKTENVALINAPPTVPGALLNNPTVVKDWHQSVTQELRHHLVQKIVQEIFPTTDISTFQDIRMINLVAYAQQLEGEMYSAANSKEEYYQLLGDKIHKIQKEFEEKRQKREQLVLQHQ